MADEQPLKDSAGLDPSTERRSGQDRRASDSREFFARGGVERRSGVEAREKQDREPGAHGGN